MARMRLTAIAKVLIAAALGLAMAFARTGPAAAQQGSPPPPNLVEPGRQRGGTSTLELPSMPAAAPQGGPALSLPPNVPQHGQELVIPSPELRQQPGYEQVTVTVTNAGGSYVTGLQKDDFKLSMGGAQRPIKFFRQDLNTPVSVGILVDSSGSMLSKMPQARAAIAQFVRDLNDKDDIFLSTFGTRTFMLQRFTADHDLVMRKIALLHAIIGPGGNTALFDAIMQGLSVVELGRYDKKAILVVTDGVDNSSSATVNDVVARARGLGVLIYSIGIGNPNGGGATFAIGPFMIGGEEEVDAQTLTTLSTETGAKTFIVHAIGDGALMRNDCETISRELREQYTLGFVAPDAAAGGYRSVHVEVPGKPGAMVRVRKGVEVGSRSGGSAYDPAGGGLPPP